MASNITAASLTVVVTEAITLNGQDLGAANTLTIASISDKMYAKLQHLWKN